jgi:hypothetical protein
MNWRDLLKEIESMQGWRYVIGDSGIEIFNDQGIKTYCRYDAIDAHNLDTIITLCKKGGKLPFKVYPEGYEFRHERKDATSDVQQDLTVD